MNVIARSTTIVAPLDESCVWAEVDPGCAADSSGCKAVSKLTLVEGTIVEYTKWLVEPAVDESC